MASAIASRSCSAVFVSGTWTETAPAAQGNFVWLALGDRTVDFAAAADEAGIVVRPFAGDGARVSIGESEANDRLIEVARAFR
jgi:histidinol-phosphate aminotransferase